MKKRETRETVRPLTPYMVRSAFFFTLTISFLLLSWAKPVSANNTKSYTLNEAITAALENNRLKAISQKSVAIAEAQYQQARTIYWPTLSLNAILMRKDENQVFLFPAQQLDIAAGLIAPVEIPEVTIDFMGRDTGKYSLEMSYSLYDGGKQVSLIDQARLGVDIASQEVHRTNLQIVQDVKRYYYAALYTQRLAGLAQEVTISFEVLRDITQAFYEGGSNTVDKLDLLQSKIAHALAESTYEALSAKHKTALAALAFTMGLDWQDQIQLGTIDYPNREIDLQLDQLIERALRFNPDIEQLSLAVKAYGAKVIEARSDHYPNIGLIASVDEFHSDLDGGLSVDQNKHSWTLAIGMELKLFDGGLTKHRISSAKLEHDLKKQQLLLLSESTAAQIKHLFIQTDAARKQVNITQQAVETSQQNLDLSNRAYRTGALETEKVIKASLMDAMVRASHARASHDQALYLAEIAYLLGNEALGY